MDSLPHFSRTSGSTFWSKKEIEQLSRYREQVKEMEEKENREKILRKQSNQMSFYRITPKEELPKALQKMNFQTLNSKEINASSYVKVFHKENIKSEEEEARKKLRKEGKIMLLSEIYNHLGDPLEQRKKPVSKFPNLSAKLQNKELMYLTNVVSELDEWEKKVTEKKKQEHWFSTKARRPSVSDEGRNSSHKKEYIVKKFKIGSNYKAEIEKNLEVISYTHSDEQNLLQKYSFIETSSKLLKKELEEMKEIVQKEIEEKMKKLSESRKQHHRLFEEKLRLQVEEQELDEEMNKDEIGIIQNLGYSMHNENQSKIKAILDEKKSQIESNETKIRKIKKTIEFLEEETIKNEEELKSILAAEKTYFLTSLKKGVDCRDTGLVWVIKKLGLQEHNLSLAQFPEYLDKKSKSYLMKKSGLEEILENLMKEKRDFVSEIGKENSRRRSGSRKSSIKLTKLDLAKIQDSIREPANPNFIDENLPRKYQRSAKKISALKEEYFQNQNLLTVNKRKGVLQFGKDLAGVSGKRIYEMTGEKIKEVDFSKLRKTQMQKGRDKIFEYQSILKEIETIHLQLDDLENHHEAHLLSHYKEQKETFFCIAAACFGAKRAYGMIIKNFSWKSAH